MHNPLHKIISAHKPNSAQNNFPSLAKSAPNGQRFFSVYSLAQKHFFWLLFALAALLACGKGQSTNQAEAVPGTEDFVDKGVTTPAGQYPIVKEGTEPITLEITALSYDPRSDGPFKIDQTNVFIQWLQKKTGVSLNFTKINDENMTERVNVMMAAGDVPDIMLRPGLSKSQINYYGANGLLRSFTPYIEKYGSVIKEVFEAKPVARPMSSDLEGNIYALPRITECYFCFRGPKAWYYKPWLDKLGLEVPQTTEQFYKMLVAFKTQDPNGNGKADEIPLTGSNIGWDDSDIYSFLAGSFLYIGGWLWLKIDSGKVVEPKISPEYRELLRYLNRLYSEGLVTDLTFTMNGSDYKRTVNGSEPPIVGVALSSYPGMFADFSPGDRGLDDFYTLPPLEGPKGVRYANVWNPYNGVDLRTVMSTSNPYPALSFRLLETTMLPEATVRAYLGIEGEDYYLAPPGTKTLTGEEGALWVNYDPEDPYPEPNAEAIQRNYAMPNRWPTININGHEKFGFISKMGRLPPKEGIDPDRADYNVMINVSSKRDYEPYNAPVSMMLPPLTIPDELIDEVEDLRSGIRDYIEIESVKFVRGEKSVETDWEKYLGDLDGLGLPRYLEIYNQLYEEQKEIWAAVQ